MKALVWSANIQAAGEQVELSANAIRITMGIAIIGALLFFLGVPLLAAGFLSRGHGSLFFGLVDGLVRIALLLLYLYAISFKAEIARLFAYHGAEHKTINAFEAGFPLDVANVRTQSTLHPRCVPGRPPGGERGGGLMFEQLEAVRARYDAIPERLSDPAVHADLKELQRLGKEQLQHPAPAQLYTAYRRAERGMDEARELAEHERDPEMQAYARQEVEKQQGERDRLEKELKAALVPKDPNDDKDVIVEIRQGTGGDEAALF